jgi:iron complex outermembrane receptor protein
MTITRNEGTARFAAASLGALLLAVPFIAAGQQADPKAAKEDTLEEIVVTGTLIAKTAPTAPAVTVITAQDLQVRGFSDVADALQQGSFSTGSVQGPQTTYGFTQGAKTLSMFSLQPGYVKYLINGLPMSDYPALYNGTDTLTSIGGIPIALVERIDILPGGQSSIYGSDAIAGVVNVIMKKKVDGAEFDARIGWTKDGGGTDRQFSAATGFDIGRMSILAGAQVNRTDPIWGYQRPLTDRYFNDGTSPAVAERDWLVTGLFGRGPNGDGSLNYYFEDPANCANVSSQVGGSVGLRSRDGHGDYCGTFKSGYATINNGDIGEQGYLRATMPVGQSSELYADVLLSHDRTTFSAGGGAFETTLVSNQYSYFYDPNLGDLMNFQHFYTPEEIGNLDSTLSDTTTDMVRFTGGLKGNLGGSWKYDVGFAFNSQKLIENTFTQITDKIDAFYAPLFGTDLGPDPFGFGVETFTPDYASFYKPITPQQYAGLNGKFVNHSRTQDTNIRAQLTDDKLFKLPGGDAALALVAEGGHQLWNYVPDAGFQTAEFYGYTSSGASYASRNRYALTSELQLPVFKGFTFDLSARYDDYVLKGQKFNKATYMVGANYDIVPSFSVRARVGTAFKAPTLSDEFQGQSGFYTGATDYYACEHNNIPIATCNIPANGSVFGVTGGNPALRPINADVWSAGLTWRPTSKLSFDGDLLHWKINDEVATKSVDQVLRDEDDCRFGRLDANSPTCVQALSQVKRDALGNITEVDTPKHNVSNETLEVLALSAHYLVNAGDAGTFSFALSWTDVLKHQLQQFPTDPVLDLLNYPYYFPNGTDFKTKANGSVTWERGDWSSTLYANRVGKSPNYLATLFIEGYATDGAADLPPQTLLNFELGYKVNAHLELTGSIINLANTLPPDDHSYPGNIAQPFNIFNYSNFGRSYRVEMKYNVGK